MTAPVPFHESEWLGLFQCPTCGHAETSGAAWQRCPHCDDCVEAIYVPVLLSEPVAALVVALDALLKVTATAPRKPAGHFATWQALRRVQAALAEAGAS